MLRNAKTALELESLGGRIDEEVGCMGSLSSTKGQQQDEDIILSLCLSSSGDWETSAEDILGDWALDMENQDLNEANDRSLTVSPSSSCSSCSSGLVSSVPSLSEGEEDPRESCVAGAAALVVPTIPKSIFPVNAEPRVQTTAHSATAIPYPPGAAGMVIPCPLEPVPVKNTSSGTHSQPKTIDVEERRRRNREAADRCRAKKRRLLESLPKENQALKKEIQDLKYRIDTLQAENITLQEQNVFLRNLVIGGAAVPLQNTITTSTIKPFSNLAVSSESSKSAAGVVLMAVACLGVFQVSGMNLPAVGLPGGFTSDMSHTGRLLLTLDSAEISKYGIFGSSMLSLVLSLVSLLCLAAIVIGSLRPMSKSSLTTFLNLRSLGMVHMMDSPLELPVWDKQREQGATLHTTIESENMKTFKCDRDQ